jgi:hypothetical protein
MTDLLAFPLSVGDISISPAAKDKAGAGGMTLASPAMLQVQSQSTLPAMSPDTRSKLPNVAAINGTLAHCWLPKECRF